MPRKRRTSIARVATALALVAAVACTRRRDVPEFTASGSEASPAPRASGSEASPAPRASVSVLPVGEAVEPAPPIAPVVVRAGPELPRGGRVLFPTYRLVGFCGTPGGKKLGKLAGNLGARAKTIESYAEQYAADRRALPVFELIAVIVQDAPGADGKHRRRVSETVVDDYLRAARAARALLLLNIQPGLSDFLAEVRHFEKYLREPDVGVALDPEWALEPHQKPGAVFGRVSGATINEVARYLASLVGEGDLPEKALVFHQVNGRVFDDDDALEPVPGVVLVKSVDGLGMRANKVATYNQLVKTMAAGVHAGFKLFFDEDVSSGGRLMTPAQVLRLSPVPDYVMYE